MLRNLLSLGNDPMRHLVGVLGLFTRPAALRAVRAGRSGLGLRLHAPDESADVNLFSTMRAFHTRENKPNSCLCETKFKVAHYRRF